MSLFSEFRRRNVFRVGAAYLIISWLLIQVSETVFPLFGFDDMPARMIVIILAIGFLPALLFAWLYELTPGGIKKEKDVEHDRSITSQTRRKLDRVIIAGLVLALAYFAWDKFFVPDEPTSAGQGDSAITAEQSIPSIAVLPFVNMSADKENEYFSDGLTETLLHILAQQPELKVAARTSAFYFKGKSIDVREIGQTLGVEHILEGSVQRVGDRVRITAQLVRADDGFHVWSENFDRTLDDIFAIQDEIAGQVAQALSESLGTPGSELHSLSTRSVDAYDLFLKGMSQQGVGSYGSLGIAESLYKQAIAADPGFTEAKLALAWNYLAQADTGLISRVSSLQQAGPLIKQAIEDNPDLPTALVLDLNYSLTEAVLRFDPVVIIESINKLVELLKKHPNQSFLLPKLVMFAKVFEEDWGLEELVQSALDIDPLKSELHESLARLLAMRGEFDRAEAHLVKAIDLTPDNPGHYASMAGLLQEKNDLAGAIRWYVRASEIDPEDPELPMQVALWLYDLDLPESADYWATRALAIAPHAPSARRVILKRAMHGGNSTEIEQASRQAVMQSTEDRLWIVRDAASELCRIHLERGTAEEAIEFLTGWYPKTLDFSGFPVGSGAYFAQRAVLQTLALTDPSFDKESVAKKYMEKVEKYILNMHTDPHMQIWVSLLAGDLESAAETAAQVLSSETFAMNPRVLSTYRLPWYKQLTEFPEVRELLTDLERQRQEQRSLTLEMLATIIDQDKVPR
jgi:TolB-like protein